MIVQKLKPWVTSFSEAIRQQYKHGDTVRVGGVITDIFSVPNVADLLPEFAKEDDPLFDAVYITLDDGVGVNHLAVPKDPYLKYQELFNIQKGMVVLAEGRVFQMEMREVITKKDKKIDREITNHPEATTRILTWKIVPLPDQTEEPTGSSE